MKTENKPLTIEALREMELPVRLEKITPPNQSITVIAIGNHSAFFTRNKDSDGLALNEDLKSYHIKNKASMTKIEEIMRLKVAIEFARQYYHLPQDVYDVFRKVSPDNINFSREGFLKEVFGKINEETGEIISREVSAE